MPKVWLTVNTQSPICLKAGLRELCSGSRGVGIDDGALD